MKIAKYTLIALGAVVLAFGITFLTLFLTGKFDKIVVQPEDVSIEISGDYLSYNYSEQEFNIVSSAIKGIAKTTTTGVTEKDVSLSLGSSTISLYQYIIDHNGQQYFVAALDQDAGADQLSNDGDGEGSPQDQPILFQNAIDKLAKTYGAENSKKYITDGKLIVPKTVRIGVYFDIIPMPNEYQNIEEDETTTQVFHNAGGISTLQAQSSNVLISKSNQITIAIDVPVDRVDVQFISTSGDVVSFENGAFAMSEGCVYTLQSVFTPTASRKDALGRDRIISYSIPSEAYADYVTFYPTEIGYDLSRILVTKATPQGFNFQINAYVAKQTDLTTLELKDENDVIDYCLENTDLAIIAQNKAASLPVDIQTLTSTKIDQSITLHVNVETTLFADYDFSNLANAYNLALSINTESTIIRDKLRDLWLVVLQRDDINDTYKNSTNCKFGFRGFGDNTQQLYYSPTSINAFLTPEAYHDYKNSQDYNPDQDDYISVLAHRILVDNSDVGKSHWKISFAQKLNSNYKIIPILIHNQSVISVSGVAEDQTERLSFDQIVSSEISKPSISIKDEGIGGVELKNNLVIEISNTNSNDILPDIINLNNFVTLRDNSTYSLVKFFAFYRGTEGDFKDLTKTLSDCVYYGNIVIGAQTYECYELVNGTINAKAPLVGDIGVFAAVVEHDINQNPVYVNATNKYNIMSTCPQANFKYFTIEQSFDATGFDMAVTLPAQTDLGATGDAGQETPENDDEQLATIIINQDTGTISGLYISLPEENELSLANNAALLKAIEKGHFKLVAYCDGSPEDTTLKFDYEKTERRFIINVGKLPDLKDGENSKTFTIKWEYAYPSNAATNCSNDVGYNGEPVSIMIKTGLRDQIVFENEGEVSGKQIKYNIDGQGIKVNGENNGEITNLTDIIAIVADNSNANNESYTLTITQGSNHLVLGKVDNGFTLSYTGIPTDSSGAQIEIVAVADDNPNNKATLTFTFICTQSYTLQYQVGDDEEHNNISDLTQIVISGETGNSITYKFTVSSGEIALSTNFANDYVAATIDSTNNSVTFEVINTLCQDIRGELVIKTDFRTVSVPVEFKSAVSLNPADKQPNEWKYVLAETKLDVDFDAITLNGIGENRPTWKLFAENSTTPLCTITYADNVLNVLNVSDVTVCRASEGKLIFNDVGEDTYYQLWITYDSIDEGGNLPFEFCAFNICVQPNFEISTINTDEQDGTAEKPFILDGEAGALAVYDAEKSQNDKTRVINDGTEHIYVIANEETYTLSGYGIKTIGGMSVDNTTGEYEYANITHTVRVDDDGKTEITFNKGNMNAITTYEIVLSTDTEKTKTIYVTALPAVASLVRKDGTAIASNAVSIKINGEELETTNGLYLLDVEILKDIGVIEENKNLTETIELTLELVYLGRSCTKTIYVAPRVMPKALPTITYNGTTYIKLVECGNRTKTNILKFYPSYYHVDFSGLGSELKYTSNAEYWQVTLNSNQTCTKISMGGYVTLIKNNVAQSYYILTMPIDIAKVVEGWDEEKDLKLEMDKYISVAPGGENCNTYEQVLIDFNKVAYTEEMFNSCNPAGFGAGSATATLSNSIADYVEVVAQRNKLILKFKSVGSNTKGEIALKFEKGKYAFETTIKIELVVSESIKIQNPYLDDSLKVWDETVQIKIENNKATAIHNDIKEIFTDENGNVFANVEVKSESDQSLSTLENVFAVRVFGKEYFLDENQTQGYYYITRNNVEYRLFAHIENEVKDYHYITIEAIQNPNEIIALKNSDQTINLTTYDNLTTQYVGGRVALETTYSGENKSKLLFEIVSLFIGGNEISTNDYENYLSLTQNGELTLKGAAINAVADVCVRITTATGAKGEYGQTAIYRITTTKHDLEYDATHKAQQSADQTPDENETPSTLAVMSSDPAVMSSEVETSLNQTSLTLTLGSEHTISGIVVKRTNQSSTSLTTTLTYKNSILFGETGFYSFAISNRANQYFTISEFDSDKQSFTITRTTLKKAKTETFPIIFYDCYGEFATINVTVLADIELADSEELVAGTENDIKTHLGATGETYEITNATVSDENAAVIDSLSKLQIYHRANETTITLNLTLKFTFGDVVEEIEHQLSINILPAVVFNNADAKNTGDSLKPLQANEVWAKNEVKIENAITYKGDQLDFNIFSISYTGAVTGEVTGKTDLIFTPNEVNEDTPSSITLTFSVASDDYFGKDFTISKTYDFVVKKRYEFVATYPSFDGYQANDYELVYEIPQGVLNTPNGIDGATRVVVKDLSLKNESENESENESVISSGLDTSAKYSKDGLTFSDPETYLDDGTYVFTFELNGVEIGTYTFKKSSTVFTLQQNSVTVAEVNGSFVKSKVNAEVDGEIVATTFNETPIITYKNLYSDSNGNVIYDAIILKYNSKYGLMLDESLIGEQFFAGDVESVDSENGTKYYYIPNSKLTFNEKFNPFAPIITYKNLYSDSNGNVRYDAIILKYDSEYGLMLNESLSEEQFFDGDVESPVDSEYGTKYYYIPNSKLTFEYRYAISYDGAKLPIDMAAGIINQFYVDGTQVDKYTGMTFTPNPGVSAVGGFVDGEPVTINLNYGDGDSKIDTGMSMIFYPTLDIQLGDGNSSGQSFKVKFDNNKDCQDITIHDLEVGFHSIGATFGIYHYYGEPLKLEAIGSAYTTEKIALEIKNDMEQGIAYNEIKKDEYPQFFDQSGQEVTQGYLSITRRTDNTDDAYLHCISASSPNANYFKINLQFFANEQFVHTLYVNILPDTNFQFNGSSNFSHNFEPSDQTDSSYSFTLDSTNFSISQNLETFHPNSLYYTVVGYETTTGEYPCISFSQSELKWRYVGDGEKLTYTMPNGQKVTIDMTNNNVALTFAQPILGEKSITIRAFTSSGNYQDITFKLPPKYVVTIKNDQNNPLTKYTEESMDVSDLTTKTTYIAVGDNGTISDILNDNANYTYQYELTTDIKFNGEPNELTTDIKFNGEPIYKNGKFIALGEDFFNSHSGDGNLQLKMYQIANETDTRQLVDIIEIPFRIVCRYSFALDQTNINVKDNQIHLRHGDSGSWVDIVKEVVNVFDKNVEIQGKELKVTTKDFTQFSIGEHIINVSIEDNGIKYSQNFEVFVNPKYSALDPNYEGTNTSKNCDIEVDGDGTSYISFASWADGIKLLDANGNVVGESLDTTNFVYELDYVGSMVAKFDNGNIKNVYPYSLITIKVSYKIEGQEDVKVPISGTIQINPTGLVVTTSINDTRDNGSSLLSDPDGENMAYTMEEIGDENPGHKVSRAYALGSKVAYQIIPATGYTFTTLTFKMGTQTKKFEMDTQTEEISDLTDTILVSGTLDSYDDVISALDGNSATDVFENIKLVKVDGTDGYIMICDQITEIISITATTQAKTYSLHYYTVNRGEYTGLTNNTAFTSNGIGLLRRQSFASSCDYDSTVSLYVQCKNLLESHACIAQWHVYDSAPNSDNSPLGTLPTASGVYINIENIKNADLFNKTDIYLVVVVKTEIYDIKLNKGEADSGQDDITIVNWKYKDEASEQAINNLTNPGYSKFGHTLVGWQVEGGNFIPVTSNLTSSLTLDVDTFGGNAFPLRESNDQNPVVKLTAIWSPNYYTIKYKSDDKDLEIEGDGYYGGELSLTGGSNDQIINGEKAFTKIGHNFVGWSVNNKTIENNRETESINVSLTKEGVFADDFLNKGFEITKHSTTVNDCEVEVNHKIITLNAIWAPKLYQVEYTTGEGDNMSTCKSGTGYDGTQEYESATYYHTINTDNGSTNLISYGQAITLDDGTGFVAMPGYKIDDNFMWQYCGEQGEWHPNDCIKGQLTFLDENPQQVGYIDMQTIYSDNRNATGFADSPYVIKLRAKATAKKYKIEYYVESVDNELSNDQPHQESVVTDVTYCAPGTYSQKITLPGNWYDPNFKEKYIDYWAVAGSDGNLLAETTYGATQTIVMNFKYTGDNGVPIAPGVLTAAEGIKEEGYDGVIKFVQVLKSAPVTIRYHANNGTETYVEGTIEATCYDSYTLQTQAFTRDGYEIAGWCLTPNEGWKVENNTIKEGAKFGVTHSFESFNLSNIKYDDQSAGIEQFTISDDGQTYYLYLYAYWQPKKYTLKLSDNNGAVIDGAVVDNTVNVNPSTFYYYYDQGFFNGDEKITSLEVGDKIGHSLSQICTATGIVVAGSDKVLTDEELKKNLQGVGNEIFVNLLWTPNVYEITLNNDGGSDGMEAIYLRYGDGFYEYADCTEPIYKIDVPTKEGHTFAGYKYNDTKIFDEKGNFIEGAYESIADNVTFTALWDKETYIITVRYAYEGMVFNGNLDSLPWFQMIKSYDEEIPDIFEYIQDQIDNTVGITHAHYCYVKEDMTTYCVWGEYSFAGFVTEWTNLDIYGTPTYTVGQKVPDLNGDGSSSSVTLYVVWE